MYYTIYKTINLINGKIYLGKHQTKNPNDSYMGSGIAIKNAIKKYGKENFKKEIIFIFDNEDEMNAKEKELINEKWVNDKNTYNKGVGGEGGPHFLGKTHSEEAKRKVAEASKKRTHSEEAKKKISEANRRRWKNPEFKKKVGKKISEIKKIKNLARSTGVVPAGSHKPSTGVQLTHAHPKFN